jgi:para-nitrobenzyl esterase
VQHGLTKRSLEGAFSELQLLSVLRTPAPYHAFSTPRCYGGLHGRTTCEELMMTTVESHEPEVRTTVGAVRGRLEDGLAVFRGIPFAEPPVGDARFQAPRPVRSWQGVREAFSFGPPPPKEGAPQSQEAVPRAAVPAAPTGDDWLTLNVWTPEPNPAARRPVMVWIYGGAYMLGFSGSPGYDARRIARDGDVVVVTFNYRLGVEGFARIFPYCAR